jgi:hypothetical protein
MSGHMAGSDLLSWGLPRKAILPPDDAAFVWSSSSQMNTD